MTLVQFPMTYQTRVIQILKSDVSREMYNSIDEISLALMLNFGKIRHPLLIAQLLSS